MKPPRGLTPEEAELWARVAATITPLRKPVSHREDQANRLDGGEEAPAPVAKPTRQRAVPPAPAAEVHRPRAAPRPIQARTLDGSWDRKLGQGVVSPDFTLDLHGHTLDSAHARLDHGLTQAIAQGARVLLLIAGKERPSEDHAGRGSRRGVIRAKVLDWLAAGSHASKIAAVRPAHPRHGGAGALYIVLRRR